MLENINVVLEGQREEIMDKDGVKQIGLNGFLINVSVGDIQRTKIDLPSKLNYGKF